MNQESNRDDEGNRDYTLTAQTLFRESEFCDNYPSGLKKYCIGIDVDKTRTATIARRRDDRRSAIRWLCCVAGAPPRTSRCERHYLTPRDMSA